MNKEMDALNRVISAIQCEIKDHPTTDLKKILQYAESLRDYNNEGKKRKFQAGVSEEWKTFINEFEKTLKGPQYTTVKRFSLGEGGVSGDGSVYDTYTIYLNSGEIVFVDIDHYKA